MKIKTTALALVALTIMGCNSTKQSGSQTGNNANADTNAIENTKWTLTTLEGQEISNPENGRDIHFMLDSKTNRVSGYSGCNTIMGTYIVAAGNRISFSQMATTRMACPDAAINESEILSVFETADNFTISNGVLSLNKAKRAPLAQFKNSAMDAAPIEEKYWKLKTLEGQDVTMSDNQEREIYFTLKTDGNRVTGFAGCNSISGEYTLEEGNRIKFDKMASTLMLCPDVDFDESEFLKVFELADNYTIVDDVLSLNVGRRAPLAVFEAVYMQ